MNKFHVVFISTPGSIGNLVPTVEFARHLTNHDPRFLATILMIDMSERPLVTSYIQSCESTATNINFINLPPVDPPSTHDYQTSLGYMCLLVTKHELHVKNAIANLITSCAETESRVVGFFVDMFCTSMIDVANELNIPCYLYFASPELGLGVEIRLDYREGGDLVSPAELERALRRLMEGDVEVRRKFLEMKEKSRMALMPNGSSYKALASLIEELTA
ncbi:UDP-glucuronosyl/UDP-glucosyltransferase [Corchorus olitorius]|uniref:UDP-glucuronosyl/UDP-glucosyltransferase n=1 Tax=Corchorus olitorius TaxID=93759 RepID=A0A1R3JII0_9ROSI|nr:UDP-glucuronosyl/UDP-glucosyltransferase [Corchorus olitorius]